MNRRKALSTLLAAAMMCGMICVPALAAEEGDPALIASETSVVSVVEVDVSALYVRSGGGVDYPAVAAVHRGDICEIVEEAYNWGKLANGAGWIYLPYTKPVSGSEPADETVTTPAADSDTVISVVVVNVGALNVRSGGGVDSPAVSVVRRGDVCEIAEEAYDWGRLANGAGWIYLPYTVSAQDWETAAPAEDTDPAESAVDPAAVISVVEVDVSALYVRSGGGVDYPAVSAVHRGDICQIVEEAYDWGKLANGAGWIYLPYTKPVAEAEAQ